MQMSDCGLPANVGSMEGLGPMVECMDVYWCAAYAEGQRGATHDTPDGAAQRALQALMAAILRDRAAAVAAERDCRTCKNWTPHHRSDVMHCSAALRCVAGSSYRRQGMVQLWEAAPVDAGF